MADPSSPKMKKIEPRTLKGFRDFTPEKIGRAHV